MKTSEPNRFTYLCAGSVKVDGNQEFARLVFTTPNPIRSAEDIDSIEDMMGAVYRKEGPASVEVVMLWTTLLRRWYEPDAPARAEPQPS